MKGENMRVLEISNETYLLISNDTVVAIRVDDRVFVTEQKSGSPAEDHIEWFLWEYGYYGDNLKLNVTVVSKKHIMSVLSLAGSVIRSNIDVMDS